MRATITLAAILSSMLPAVAAGLPTGSVQPLEIYGPDFSVRGGDGQVGVLADIYMTLIQDRNPTLTDWTLHFHAANSERDVEGRGNPFAVFHVLLADGHDVPGLPALKYNNWRDQCYSGSAGDRDYTGTFAMHYNDLVSLASTLGVGLDGGINGRQAKC